ncbi:hypothetical protein TNCV_4053141 [Trichonephila clavipes]|nr:hypothetical protein TNCV_4053141 [Trichonephila clavipes]
MTQNRWLRDQSSWLWGLCLLFDLGEAPTPRLAVIMVKGMLAPIDHRRSLSVHRILHAARARPHLSASRTDVAPSIEVSDLFTLEPLSFDVMAATDYIDNCTTCTESEDLCALKCSRRSIRLQNAEFKKYIREVELSKRAPTAASPASQQKRIQAKRQPASPQKDVPSKKQAKSERKLPRTSTSPRHIEDAASSMEEGESSAEESSEEVNSAKTAKSVIAPSSPAAKAAESASAPDSNQKDDGFTTVGRNGKRIAPIVIDAQSNATELLTQIGGIYVKNIHSRGAENGKPEFSQLLPKSTVSSRNLSRTKKCGPHTFEMAHNKQLKVVLRGLPTDYNQEESHVRVTYTWL